MFTSRLSLVLIFSCINIELIWIFWILAWIYGLPLVNHMSHWINIIVYASSWIHQFPHPMEILRNHWNSLELQTAVSSLSNVKIILYWCNIFLNITEVWREAGLGREPWERSEASGTSANERHLRATLVSSPTAVDREGLLFCCLYILLIKIMLNVRWLPPPFPWTLVFNQMSKYLDQCYFKIIDTLL